MTPKVSVIIPIYNTEKYLRQCLDSVVNQTLKDIEIICINDGSTDNSLDILKEYASKDNRIIIINKKSEGVSAARNIGIKKATAQYIHFLDSDDYISINFYKSLYQTAIKENSDLAICACKKFFENSNKTEDFDFFSYNCKNLNMFVTSPVWTYIFKNKFEIKFNSTIKNGEDDLYSFLLFKQIKNYSYNANAYYFYRQRKNSASVKYVEIENCKGRLLIISKLYNYLVTNNITAEQIFSFYKMFDLEFTAINKYKFISLDFFLRYSFYLKKICIYFKNTKYYEKLLIHKKINFKDIRRNLVSLKTTKKSINLKLFNQNLINIDWRP